VRLRPVTEADLPFLRRVYAESRAEEMALVTHWSDDQKAEFLRLQFEAQHAHYTRHYPDARFEVIALRGEDVGRLYVARLPEEIRLMDIALLARHRGAGIGGALLRALLDEARRDGLPVSLHVEDNNPARRLYARLGFVRTGEEGIYARMRWSPEAPASAGAASGA
jgi:GNAT superfamily N-acetyltransferase